MLGGRCPPHRSHPRGGRFSSSLRPPRFSLLRSLATPSDRRYRARTTMYPIRPWLAVLAFLCACSNPPPAVWLVPAAPELTVASGTERALEVIRELGYSDPTHGPGAVLQTEWQYDPGTFTSARSRVQLRMKDEAPFAIAVRVPRERLEGRRWVPDGEDEERRQNVVAALTARLAPAPKSPGAGSAPRETERR